MLRLDDSERLTRNWREEPLEKGERYIEVSMDLVRDPEQVALVHPDEPLYAEAFCTCGMIRRMRAFAKDLLPFVTEWAAHFDEDGHDPCDKATAFLGTIHTRLVNNPGKSIAELADEARIDIPEAAELAAWYLAVEAERLAGAGA